MVTKAVRSEWRPESGILIVYGEAGDASDGIAIPITALPALGANARRYLSGQAAKQNAPPNHGQWHYSQLCNAQTYNVGLLPTTNGEKVALVLDQGLETEIGFAIEPEHARELGQELAETAVLASNSPTAKN